MSSCPPDPTLTSVLSRIATRRHRVPELPRNAADARRADPWTALAFAIERARIAVEHGGTTSPDEHALFTDTLLRLIRDAMHPDRGDASFQAMVLRHHAPRVREYASLSAGADADRRRIKSIVNALAHPAKLARQSPGPARDSLILLHQAATRMDWPALRAFPALHDDASLARLIRLDELSSDAHVLRYRALIQQQGPAAGSEAALDQGAQAQRRGARVEAICADAMALLAAQLNGPCDPTTPHWRIASSLRVPGLLAGDASGAKVEWDVALLRRAERETWHLMLLIEAKASADAASTDLPKLLRGLRLLRAADPSATYLFKTAAGELRLTGASLAALDADAPDLGGRVLYCCEGDEDLRPRLLSAASRMQLLSAETGLEVAARLERGDAVEAPALTPVWDALRTSPRFLGVLHQYATLLRVRALMVHPDDLADAAHAPHQP